MSTLSLLNIESEIKRRHLENWYILDVLSNYKDSFIIYGAASVAITDREGHKITIPALKKAVAKFMENPKYRDLNIFHCIRSSTEILVNRQGSKYLPISEIKVGDKVMTHSGKWRKVREVIVHDMNGPILKLELSNGNIIHITDEHPVLTRDRGWVKAGQLTTDDVLLHVKVQKKYTSTDNLTPLCNKCHTIIHNKTRYSGILTNGTNIVSIKQEWHIGKIYNLEVDVDHTYSGRGIIFHNSDVQVGEILPYWIHPSTGKVYRTEVNDSGWWVVAKLRGDLEIAKKVREEVEKGNLKAFSIAGTAKNKSHDYDTLNPHENINDLEIYECVVPETRIQTLNGEKEISFLSLDDYVLTHTMKFKPVDKLIKHYIDGVVCEIPFDNGSILNITPNHPVLTKQDGKDVWERADDLTYKIPIYNYLGIWEGLGKTNIKKIVLHNYEGVVYNLEVRDDHSYIANNIVVKNCTICCVPETKVVTASGLVDIINVNVGDIVLTHNKRYMLVSKTFKRYVNEQLFTIKTASGKIIRVTAEHPILTKNRGWVAAKNIVIGDDL